MNLRKKLALLGFSNLSGLLTVAAINKLHPSSANIQLPHELFYYWLALTSTALLLPAIPVIRRIQSGLMMALIGIGIQVTALFIVVDCDVVIRKLLTVGWHDSLVIIRRFLVYPLIGYFWCQMYYANLAAAAIIYVIPRLCRAAKRRLHGDS